MTDKSLEEILKLADEMGIKYEVNSKTPGIFIKNTDGQVKKVELEDIILQIKGE